MISSCGGHHKRARPDGVFSVLGSRIVVRLQGGAFSRPRLVNSVPSSECGTINCVRGITRKPIMPLVIANTNLSRLSLKIAGEYVRP